MRGTLLAATLCAVAAAGHPTGPVPVHDDQLIRHCRAMFQAEEHARGANAALGRLGRYRARNRLEKLLVVHADDPATYASIAYVLARLGADAKVSTRRMLVIDSARRRTPPSGRMSRLEVHVVPLVMNLLGLYDTTNRIEYLTAALHVQTTDWRRDVLAPQRVARVLNAPSRVLGRIGRDSRALDGLVRDLQHESRSPLEKGRIYRCLTMVQNTGEREAMEAVNRCLRALRE